MAEFAGTLRELVAIEQWRTARDDTGGDAGVWVAGDVVHAALVPTASDVAVVVGEGLASRQRYRLTLRHRTDIGLSSRFRWGTRVLAVLRIETDPRVPDRLTCLVEERT